MRFASSLTGYGYYGICTPPAWPFNAVGEDFVSSAIKRGGFRNLKHHVPGLGNAGRGNGVARQHREDPSRVHAIGLGFTRTYPNGYNLTSAWRDLLNSGLYFSQCTNPFRGNCAGLFHTDCTLNRPSAYSSSYMVGPNEAVGMRLWLFKPPKDQPRPLLQIIIGNYMWQLADGSAEIMRRKADVTNSDGTTTPGWSQAQEDSLNALLAAGSLTPTQQATMDSLRAAIYSDYQTAGSAPSGGWYDNPIELLFIPEPLGRLNMVVGEGQDARQDVFDNTDILATRAAGTMWPSTPVTIKCSSGAYIWQLFYLNHNVNGTLLLPPYNRSAGSSTLTTGGLWDVSNAGTSVTVAEQSINANWSQIAVQLATTNPKVSPFFYSCYGTLDAGERNGSDTESWSSDDHLDSQNNSPILDVQVQFEGDAETCGMRRRQYAIKLRDPNGTTFNSLESFHYEVLEHRVADLAIGPVGGDLVNLIQRGLIVQAGPTDLRQATQNLPRIQVMKATTESGLILCDEWALAEEDLIVEDVIPYPGEKLGSYLRRVLRGMGVKDAAMTGINANDGIVLPQAVIGEAPAVRPQFEAVRADYLRELIKLYGRGWILYIEPTTGIWTFAPRPTALGQITWNSVNYDIKFTSIQSSFDATSYPGRFAVLKMLKADRNVQSFWNTYRAEGGKDQNGDPIVETYTINNSINAVDTPTSKKFIGRIKRMPTIHSDALRSVGDVTAGVSNTASWNGVPPRYWEWESYYHPNLAPGMLGMLDNINIRIERIPSGSSAEDMMVIGAREVE